MPIWQGPFLYLDIAQLIILLLQESTLAFLLVSSVLSRLRDCIGIYTRCPSLQPNETYFLDDEQGQEEWNFDWIGIDQYVLLVTLSAISLFACYSTFSRRRNLVFTSILLYLIHLIQIVLNKTTDDRDFPNRLYLEPYSWSRYALIYTENSVVYLVLKSLLALLTIAHYLTLNVYFVLLRYTYILFDTNLHDVIKQESPHEFEKEPQKQHILKPTKIKSRSGPSSTTTSHKSATPTTNRHTKSSSTSSTAKSTPRSNVVSTAAAGKQRLPAPADALVLRFQQNH